MIQRPNCLIILILRLNPAYIATIASNKPTTLYDTDSIGSSEYARNVNQAKIKYFATIQIALEQ